MAEEEFDQSDLEGKEPSHPKQWLVGLTLQVKNERPVSKRPVSNLIAALTDTGSIVHIGDGSHDFKIE